MVSLLSSYHHVNFAVWVLPFSIISLYLLIDPTYNMEVIFFLFWLNGVNIHFFFSKQVISYWHHCQSKIFTISNSEAYSAKTDHFLFSHRDKIHHFPRRITDVYASLFPTLLSACFPAIKLGAVHLINYCTFAQRGE